MTEEESKSKWCPYTQKAHGPADEFGVANCIGSRCMMWRLEKEERPAFVPGKPAPKYRIVPIKGGGYCGLAGKP